MKRSDSLMSEGDESQKLELFVSCRHLDSLHMFSVCDSFLVVKLVEQKGPQKIILKSKVYWSDTNPNYAETVMVDFYFQIRQRLIFEVYNHETVPKLIGKMQTSVGQIFGSAQHGLIRDLTSNHKKSGNIIVRFEKESKNQKKIMNFKIGAKNLPNLTWWFFFGGTSAFFRIFRKRKQDELLVYESQAIANNINPSWRQFKLSQRRLLGVNKAKEIQIRIYNFSKNGAHQHIGTAFLDYQDIATGRKYKIRSKNENKGDIYIQKYYERTQYQFGDFIQAGLQLSLVTCIDFTASNGIFAHKDSLHFSTSTKKSQYEQALTEVSNILLDYDYDKLVPMYGFGAKANMPNYSTQNKVSHCFPINGNTQNPNLYKIDEIIESYRNVRKYLQFSGPTKFSQLLKEAIEECKDFQKLGTNYMILFILTDGEIHDKAEVIDLLIQCNRLPISIIIVGLGDGTFDIMDELDDDNCEMVDSQGRHTQRDLVQFVEFSKFKNNGVQLAREVLFELPRQVSEYYQLSNLAPIDVTNSYKVDDIAKVIKFKEDMFNPYDI